MLTTRCQIITGRERSADDTCASVRLHGEIQNVVVVWLTFLLRIREVPDSNFGPEAGYPKIFRGFPQSVLENASIVP
jgi:hypothetical protein